MPNPRIVREEESGYDAAGDENVVTFRPRGDRQPPAKTKQRERREASTYRNAYGFRRLRATRWAPIYPHWAECAEVYMEGVIRLDRERGVKRNLSLGTTQRLLYALFLFSADRNAKDPLRRSHPAAKEEGGRPAYLALRASAEDLAARIGIDERTVRRHLGVLKDGHFLRIETNQRDDGGDAANTIELALDAYPRDQHPLNGGSGGTPEPPGGRVSTPPRGGARTPRGEGARTPRGRADSVYTRLDRSTPGGFQNPPEFTDTSWTTEVHTAHRPSVNSPKTKGGNKGASVDPDSRARKSVGPVPREMPDGVAPPSPQRRGEAATLSAAAADPGPLWSGDEAIGGKAGVGPPQEEGGEGPDGVRDPLKGNPAPRKTPRWQG